MAYQEAGLLNLALNVYNKEEMYTACCDLLDEHPDYIPTGSYSRDYFLEMHAMACFKRKAHEDAAAAILKLVNTERRMALATKWGQQHDVYGDVLIKELRTNGEFQQAAEYLFPVDRIDVFQFSSFPVEPH